ncbi:pam16 domain-containing protein [Ditylenchus destructor]|uniref:Mitochondrial import inner membrane translocase subunit tim-16 n=1 Tax=Ditylenchus destructor TaxID=166010 RepID=A0AAD4MZW7_9BILA|nr:pam16 domain-containing protein [Ditylenchus destructor]
MVVKDLVKVAIALGEAVGKAFTRAVKEEYNASRHAAQKQASSSTSSKQSVEREATRTNARLGITLDESMKILNVNTPLKKEEIEQRYKHLFEANDPVKGSGSRYLQSKVYRAKERLDEEFGRMERGEGQTDTTSTDKKDTASTP